MVLKHVHVDENFLLLLLLQKMKILPFYLGIPSVIFQVSQLPPGLIRHTKKKKKKTKQIKYRISLMYKLTLWRLHFFISLITGN